MADAPASKKDLDALTKKVDALQKQVDALLKWADGATGTINKDFDDLASNVGKDIQATKDWAKGELDKLAKAINAK